MRQRIAIVGAGFSGAVLARQLAESGHTVTIFDSRPHIAGNCHTYRDKETGIMLHAYGPHIFHTDDEKVWQFVNHFAEIMPFTNRVKAIANGKVFSFPVNLLTINSFFNLCLSPEDAASHIRSLAVKFDEVPASFEQQALSMIGRDIYSAFFEGYSWKQWGISPSEIPASVLKRLPIRFNYDDNYYTSKYQGIPRLGYTSLVNNIIDHPSISCILDHFFHRSASSGYDHVFYTGPIDQWFDYEYGRLAYRTLRFSEERHHGDFQGNAVINYCDRRVPWTRISEHKHFAPWEQHEKTVIYKEFSDDCGPDDVPYYPLRTVKDKDLLQKYVAVAKLEQGVTFLGRLGTYRYLDMDKVIKEALDASSIYLDYLKRRDTIPVFITDPLA
jgi:UDP-galactopyranose mutase